MSQQFLTFQKFNNLESANAMADLLKENSIESEIENERNYFDPSMAKNNFASDINVKITPNNFTKANNLLEIFYANSLENIEPDYYLLEFTDAELMEIITKPDEWGHFDYVLAKKLLSDRGKEIKPEILELLKTQRIKENSKQESSSKSWIYVGYVSAFLGGLLGLAIGWTLAYHKRTLSNGERVYVYDNKSRKQGEIIFIISICVFVCAIIYKTINNIF